MERANTAPESSNNCRVTVESVPADLSRSRYALDVKTPGD